MAKKADKPSKDKNLEEEVWNAISAFEQILEAMPNDRASLEALSHAYEQIGDHVKAKEYLVRLGNVLLDERDSVSAVELLPLLEKYSGDDEDAAGVVERIRGFVGDAGTEIAPAGGANTPEASKSAGGKDDASAFSTFSMAEELSFAWNLMEAGMLTQEEYASVVQDLTEMSSSESGDATISVLHVLEARAFKGLEKIMAYAATECGAPIIQLSGFDLQANNVGVFPMDFMIHRGTCFFERLGGHGLVVVMNPYDKQLREDIEKVAECPCHFFVTTPTEFDAAVGKAADLIAESKEDG